MRIELSYTPQPKQALLHAAIASEILFGGCAGGGKQVSVDTLIPTPDGFRAIGDLVVGDTVFAESGSPTRVIGVSVPEMPAECYDVVFDTGEVVIADGRHLWVTMTDAERMRALRLTGDWRAKRRAQRPSRAKSDSRAPWTRAILDRLNRERVHEYSEPPTGKARTTAEIRETLKVRGRVNHSVCVAGSLMLPDAMLPIDPYVFGLWLGDGNSDSGLIGMLESDWAEILPFCAERVFSRNVSTKARRRPFERIRFDCLTTRLRTLGLLGQKRIPVMYLRGSEAQRLSLLQGFMDTDGHCDTRGQCELLLSDKDLLEDAWELVSSLGIKARIREKPVKGYGSAWRIKFVSERPVFRLPRKVERQKTAGFRPTTGRRFIVDIRRVKPRTMRCIQVDDPSHCYLVGRSFIPTHNSHGLRWDAYEFCMKNPGCVAVLVRQTLPQLEKNHIRKVRRELPRELGEYNETRKVFNWWNGSILAFQHLEYDKDLNDFQGDEIHWLGIDEASLLRPEHIAEIKTRCRLGDWKPTDSEAVKRLPRLAMTANPGGPSHEYLKDNYIDPAVPGEMFEHRVKVGDKTLTKTRVFIKSKMADNRYLDDDYEAQFIDLPEWRAKQLRDGDWDVVPGAFFDCWDPRVHVIQPFEVPPWWPRIRSCDWGFATPFSIGEWVISDGTAVVQRDGTRVIYPKDCSLRVWEWYGGRKSKGLRLDALEVASRVIRERGRALPGPADTNMWEADNGPSPAAKFARAGMPMFQADKRREAGWQELYRRLKTGMLRVTSDCRDCIRTVPAQMADPMNPNDVKKKSDDHVVDEMRYFVMSRPLQYEDDSEEGFEAFEGRFANQYDGALSVVH